MAIQLGWYLEKRVLYERFYLHVTTDELTSMAQRANTLLEHAETPVHTLIDLSDVKTFPSNLTKIQDAFNAVPETERGWIVVVMPDSSPLLHFVVSYAVQARSGSAPFRMFRTLATAVDFLNQQDPFLNLSVRQAAINLSLIADTKPSRKTV